MHGRRDAGAYIDSRRQQCPLTSGAYNAELSAPDQMTNITAETRPQSYLQLSGQRPSTQEQFSKLILQFASVFVCVCACVMIAQCCPSVHDRVHTSMIAAADSSACLLSSVRLALNRLIVPIQSTDSI